MIRRILLVIMTGIILIFNSCDTTDPGDSDTGNHNKILFTSKRSGADQLYMMKPDGTDIKQITSGQYWNRNGRWSPDANKICYNTTENYEVMNGEPLILIDFDNNTLKEITYGRCVSWYPNGSKILFNNWSGGGFVPLPIKLYSINSDGKNRTFLSSKHVGDISFSPDGSHFVRTVLVNKTDVNYRMVIFNYPQFNDSVLVGPEFSYDPKWSHKGNKIVFSKRDPLRYNIFIMNSDGTNVKQITNNNSDQIYRYPVWSPNDEKIIFLAFVGDGKSYLFMVNNDGSDLHRLLEDDDYVSSCDWSK
jgi:TolB protein